MKAPDRPWLCAGCDEPTLGLPHAFLDPPEVRWTRRRRVCSPHCTLAALDVAATWRRVLAEVTP